MPCTPTQSPRSSRLIAANASLKVAGPVADRSEHELARVAHQHDAARNGDHIVGLDARIELTPPGTDIGHRVGAIEAVGIRGDPGSPQVVELRQTTGLLGGESTTGRRRVGQFLDGVVGGGIVGAHGPPTVSKRSDRCALGSDLTSDRWLRTVLWSRACSDQDHRWGASRVRDRAARHGARARRLDRRARDRRQPSGPSQAALHRRGHGVQLGRTPSWRFRPSGGGGQVRRRIPCVRPVGQRGDDRAVSGSERSAAPTTRIRVPDGCNSAAQGRRGPNHGT